ncbi:MAG: cellulase family glycosylhydrolase [Clostridia bacterium]|nr:cellulase family glycosylhydrolase [Clostridia bacterium]
MFIPYREENRDRELHIEGNRLLDRKGNPVMLTGVNCASLEWLSAPEKLLKTVTVALDDWHANTIRLPLSQDRWFGFGGDQQGTDESGEIYRGIVDSIVEAVAARRKYVILDLHRSNCGSWGEFISGNMPDMNSLVFWKSIAARYGNHPNVLFGIFNEPFKVSWDCWRDGGEITVEYAPQNIGNQIMRDESGEPVLETITFHTPGLQKMVDTVRAVGAKNIAIVAGLDWGYELDGVAKGYVIEDHGGNGIMLDSHEYPWKKLDNWAELVDVVKDRYPILIGECGHYGENVEVYEGPQREPSHLWVPRLLNWVEKNGYHITAWDFHDTAGPSLIKDLESFKPTEFWGVYFKEFLKKRNG